MTLSEGHPLRQLVSRARGPLLVLHDATTAGLLADLEGRDVHIAAVGGHVPGAPRRWHASVLVVADALSFRQAVSVLPPLGRSRAVAWWLAEAEEAAPVVPRPEWPAVTALHARTLRSGGAFTTLRAEGPVPVDEVLGQAARALAPATLGRGGPVIATTDHDPIHAPPADLGLVVVATAADSVDPDRRVPPDIVLSADAEAAPLPDHDIIARAPARVSDPDLLAGPLDEGLLNPAGFLRHPARGEVTLSTDGDGRVRLAGSGLDRSLDRGVTPAAVATLRDHLGVRVTWTDRPPAAHVRAVAALAMAGVPVVGDPPPRSTTIEHGPRLGPRLAAALADHADLHTPLAREEHSVRLRRAALLEHSTLAWRERLAATAGVSFRRLPTCSIVLRSSRPTRLELALRQVGRQRGADVELVVVAHGWSPDERRVRARSAHPVTVREVQATASPGEALDVGVEAASGDLVVSFEEGDWYGADVAADLLLARHYSGASLVVMPRELVYVEDVDRTLRRSHDSERTVTSVASGAAMTIGRDDLRDLGGFRRGPEEDPWPVADVRSRGGRVYATHGLGHLARRTGAGHPRAQERTGAGRYWPDDPPIDEQWDGFRPSRLLEVPPEDRPPAKESPA